MFASHQNPKVSSRGEKIVAFHDSLIGSVQWNEPSQLWKISGWSSASSQRVRFERLLRASSYSGGSILDWGCGPGDLYSYLEATNYPFVYKGLDVNPRMISLAQSRFGELFEQVDLSYRLSESYDYVFASGLFQFSDQEDPLYYLKIIKNMYEFARRAVAVNLLSTFRDDRNKVSDELYVDPVALTIELNKVSPKWLVDHSYHPGAGDFTIALIKPDPGLTWTRPDFPMQER